jgi:hypothetical protein
MSLKQSSFVGSLIFVVISVSAWCFSAEEDLVPDETTAVKVAEVILESRYGPNVLNQRPFKAKLSDKLWVVRGTLNCPKGPNCKGGVAHIEISKKDGQVTKVIHEK